MGKTGKRVALGLDIGGTKIKAVALSETGKVLSEFACDSLASKGPQSVRKALHHCVKHFRDEELEFSSIGVGCAGSVNPRTGVVRNSPNFSSWKDIPLRDWIEEDFDAPAVVDNDANCAVFTEWKLGHGKGYENVILLTLGTGIGGGIIINGNLFRGATGTGGELGHMSIYANGKPCNCGNRGCFERYCSATAIKEMAGHNVSAKEIFTKSETPAHAAIITKYLEDFQTGLTSLANIFDPDIILLGGAMSEGVSRYLPQIHEWIKTHAFPAVGKKVKLKLARFGNFSGGIGAALLSLSESPQITEPKSHNAPSVLC